MRTLFFFLSIISFTCKINAVIIDSTSYISSETGSGYFTLTDSDKSAPLLISSSDFPGVIIALKNLQNDIRKVTGIRPHLYVDTLPASQEVIIVGTLGKSSIINTLVKNNKFDTTELSDKWEKFILQIVENPLPGISQAAVIVGSDKRGTIYGIYDLSEQIGVSPWYWWADVPIQHKPSLYIIPDSHTRGEPAVKYRGIFINDEAPALSGWVSANYGSFNHHFYEKVFELVLRLKGNYLWPAMWGKSFFEDDTLNPALADEYGVVIGTSHHEPMHRAQKDWSVHGTGDWNYETNGENLRNFWREGISRMGDKESIVTIGMRGDGDEPMSDETVIDLLETIVGDQRYIIQDATGKDPAGIPQVWALYKEVQDYYDKGMTVPEDVTLLFSDDNWGNIRRLPNPEDETRSGGYGIYYHYDYVGGPRSYKWLNTNPIPRIWEQMHLTYQHGVDRIWIVNVGDLKPMEFPMSFFLDFAWAPDKWTPENLSKYASLWAEQQFGSEYASSVAKFLSKYGKYNGRRKPELIDEKTYSIINYREAETVVAAYNQLADEVDSVYKVIPSEYRDAYYQLVKYPIAACANLNDLYFNVAKNHLYAAQGRAATNDYAEKARALFERDASLTDYYHNTIAGGKWNHMIDQPHIGYTSWSSPSSNIMPDVTEIDLPAVSGMGVAIEGSEDYWPKESTEAILPQFDIFHKQVSYIEVFNRGTYPFEYSVRAGSPCIQITPAAGKVYKEQRLLVSIDWQQAPIGLNTVPITINGPDGKAVTVKAVVRNPESPKPNEVSGFIETNGYLSMEASHYNFVSNSGENWWKIIPDLGKTSSGITTFPVVSQSITPDYRNPRLSYNVYLFSTGTVKVHTYLSPTINYYNRPEGMRYGISFDMEEPQIISFNGDNNSARADNIVISTSSHTIDQPGNHILKFWLVDPGVLLQKIVIETKSLQSSYLGPPEEPYDIIKTVFIVAAEISQDGKSIEVTFNSDIDSSSLRIDDFTIRVDGIVNPIVSAILKEQDDNAVIFTQANTISENEKVILDYTPGTLKSAEGIPLDEIESYVVQQSLMPNFTADSQLTPPAQVQVFPLPFNDRLYFVNLNAVEDVTILDISGREIIHFISSGINKLKIITSALNKGVYIASFLGWEEMSSVKIVKY